MDTYERRKDAYTVQNLTLVKDLSISEFQRKYKRKVSLKYSHSCSASVSQLADVYIQVDYNVNVAKVDQFERIFKRCVTFLIKLKILIRFFGNTFSSLPIVLSGLLQVSQ